MTFSWPRLTWPALALRHAAPWARKTSATSRRGRAMRPRSGGRRSAREVEAQPLQRARDVADRVDGDAGVEPDRDRRDGRGGVDRRRDPQRVRHADRLVPAARLMDVAGFVTLVTAPHLRAYTNSSSCR